MNDELYFRSTLDTLTPLMIQVLMDIIDGEVPFSICTPWIWDALVSRGLVVSPAEIIRLGKNFNGELLTIYGRAFLMWYRQPRELPGQMELDL